MGNRSVNLIFLTLAASVLLGCQVAGPSPTAQPASTSAIVGPERITFPAPDAWGGEARCTETGCKIILVEHEKGQLVLHQVKERKVTELDRHPVAYHPDSAKWLTDDWVVAAVERDHALDMFTLKSGRLTRQIQLIPGFPPRDVVVLERNQHAFTLLATPYNGKNVAVIEWSLGAKGARVSTVPWCEAPWHPAAVSRGPQGRGKGVVAACLDDKKLVYVSANDWKAAPTELARFDAVARQARPSPSGKWVYVALEVGAKNARLDMDSGELQLLDSPLTGAVSVAPLSDDLVIWGESNSLYLQRFDSTGKVLETKWLRSSGFPTELQLIDMDGDGERDLLILNSAGKLADVYFGPIWDRALEKL